MFVGIRKLEEKKNFLINKNEYDEDVF